MCIIRANCLGSVEYSLSSSNCTQSIYIYIYRPSSSSSFFIRTRHSAPTLILSSSPSYKQPSIPLLSLVHAYLDTTRASWFRSIPFHSTLLYSKRHAMDNELQSAAAVHASVGKMWKCFSHMSSRQITHGTYIYTFIYLYIYIEREYYVFMYVYVCILASWADRIYPIVALYVCTDDGVCRARLATLLDPCTTRDNWV